MNNPAIVAIRDDNEITFDVEVLDSDTNFKDKEE